MRIALGSIHPRPLSGQIEGLVGLAQALRRAGHVVTVASPFPSETLLGADRFALAAQPQRIIVDQPGRIARVLTSLKRLAMQADVVQLNLPTPAFSMFADLLQSLVRVPVIVGYEAHLVSVRDLVGHKCVRQAPAFYLPRLVVNNRLIARMALQRAACYVVTTRTQRDELVGLGIAAHRIQILPPVLPCDKLVRGSDALRGRLPHGRIITYIGHYNHVKGVDILVRAFQMLAPRLPELSLALAWSGVGSDASLDRLLSDPALRGRVYQLGRVAVPDLLSASDLVVLPYRMTIGQAAFPAVLAEAFAAQVPVITTDLPHVSELTENGSLAMLVPPEDPAALAAGMECLLTEPHRAAQIRRAQRDYLPRLEPQCIVREYEKLYRQVSTEQKGFLQPPRDRQ